MRLVDLKIAKKILGGFGITSGIFVVAIVYQFANTLTLAKMQDEGAQRAKDAMEIGQVMERMVGSYSVMADPTKQAIAALNLEIKKKQAEGKVSAKDASLLAQRWHRLAEESASEEDAEVARAQERFWMEQAGNIVREQGGKLPAKEDPKRAKTPTATVDEKAAIAEMQRLIKAGHTKQTAIEAMKQLGWPVK